MATQTASAQETESGADLAAREYREMLAASQAHLRDAINASREPVW